MNITVIKKLPPVEDIIQEFPLSDDGLELVNVSRREVKDIIEGKDSRYIVVVGPCSAWPKEAVFEYAVKLKKLEEKVRDALKIVMRVYIQKPRTTKGWTGPVNQPDPLDKADIAAGIRYCREMMVRVVHAGLPIADEALFTHNTKGFLELLSWVAIGARSAEDQEHRLFASALDCAVGLKNPTAGSIEIGVNSVVAAQHPHTAVLDGYEVRTHGNPYAHLVLRGGEHGPNYRPEDLAKALSEMKKHAIKNPSLVIDVSHDNAKVGGVKHAKNQVEAVHEIMATLHDRPELRGLVKGFMIESFLKEGCQKAVASHPENLDLGGLSITDPCLGWDTTEELLHELAEFKRKHG